ncbi:restriction endonuclease subunit S [Aeromonas veronii]|uniref:restriction endonuclease subunit S n=1 Tax=Aeromonas veronii TaxID=654 RepID=UPI003D1A373E
MGLELITYSISDIGKVITGKTPPASIKSAYSALDGVPFVTPKDMDGRRWIENTERYLTSDGVAAVKRNLVPAMSVAVSCIGSDMGKAVLLKKESITNQQINSIVIDVKRFNPKYIYYVLSTKQQYFKDIAGGSATPILNKTDFGKITFQAPSKYYQDLIVEYLDCLDSKRELNRQINQTLEQMAQALFKSWFVDFDPVIDNALDAGFFEQDLALPDELLRRAEARRAVREHGDFKPLPDATRQLFPAAFEESDEPSLGLGGWVPQGWAYTMMNDLVEIASSKRVFAKDYMTSGIPFYRGKEISELSKGNEVKTEIFISEEKYNELRDKAGAPKAGDILITSVGTIGNTYLVREGDQFYFKDGNLTWIKDYKKVSIPYYLSEWFKTSLAKNAIEKIKIGTTQQAITIQALNTLSILEPSKDVLCFFEQQVASNREKYNANIQQINDLNRLRDTLLPKLISGELRLDNIEAQLTKDGVA